MDREFFQNRRADLKAFEAYAPKLTVDSQAARFVDGVALEALVGEPGLYVDPSVLLGIRLGFVLMDKVIKAECQRMGRENPALGDIMLQKMNQFMNPLRCISKTLGELAKIRPFESHFEEIVRGASANHWVDFYVLVVVHDELAVEIHLYIEPEDSYQQGVGYGSPFAVYFNGADVTADLRSEYAGGE